jgi:hypothetical protein
VILVTLAPQNISTERLALTRLAALRLDAGGQGSWAKGAPRAHRGCSSGSRPSRSTTIFGGRLPCEAGRMLAVPSFACALALDPRAANAKQEGSP